MTRFDQIKIKQLNSKEEIAQAYEIFNKKYDVTISDFNTQIDEMIAANNFKIIAAFIDDKIVGVAGYWLLRMFYCGRYLQVSSLIVDQNSRNLGIGSKILDEIENIAKAKECKKIILDAFVDNKKSHSLYYRKNFHIRGFHFMKDL